MTKGTKQAVTSSLSTWLQKLDFGGHNVFIFSPLTAIMTYMLPRSWSWPSRVHTPLDIISLYEQKLIVMIGRNNIPITIRHKLEGTNFQEDTNWKLHIAQYWEYLMCVNSYCTSCLDVNRSDDMIIMATSWIEHSTDKHDRRPAGRRLLNLLPHQ